MRLRADTRGATTVEYLIVIAIVAVAAIGAWSTFGGGLTSKIDEEGQQIAAMEGAGLGTGGESVSGVPAALSIATTTPDGTTSSGSGDSDDGGSFWGGVGDFLYAAGTFLVASQKGVWFAAYDTVAGLASLGWSGLRGLWWVVNNPVESAEGVWHAVTHPVETATAAWDFGAAVVSGIGTALGNAWETVKHGSWEERGDLLGRAVFEAALTVGTGGAGHATKARWLGKVDDLARAAARGAENADDVADAARAVTHLDEAALAARRAARPSADEIRAESRRLYDRYNDDEMFDRMIAQADRNGGFATRDPDLAFTTVDRAALEGIMERGVLPGSALGRAGPNAEKIWFGDGAPFYGEGVTLVIPKSRLSELYGGRASSGLHGQANVITVPGDAVPNGIPFDEFAVVESLGRGYVAPIHIPPGWRGGVGPRLPDPLPTE